jgi:hypothetical protein
MSVDVVSVRDVASGKSRGDDAGYVGGYNSKAAVSLVMNRGEIQVRQLSIVNPRRKKENADPKRKVKGASSV